MLNTPVKLGLLFLFLLLLAVSACELLYPPAYYTSIVGPASGTNTNTGGEASAGAWKIVTQASFSSPPGQIQIQTRSDNMPVVAVMYNMGTNGFNIYNGGWATYPLNLGSLSSFSLALNADLPYIACDNGTIFSFSGGMVSSNLPVFYYLGYVGNMSLAFVSGIPVIEYSAGGGFFTSYYDGVSSWNTNAIPFTGNNPKLMISQGKYLLTYTTNAIGSNYVEYRSTAGTLLDLTNASESTMDILPSIAIPSITASQGKIYSVYYIYNNPVVTSSYDGASLTILGAVPIGASVQPVIGANDSGAVYLAVIGAETNTNFTYNYPLYVYKLSGASWSQVGDRVDDTTSSFMALTFAAAPNGKPYIGYAKYEMITNIVGNVTNYNPGYNVYIKTL